MMNWNELNRLSIKELNDKYGELAEKSIRGNFALQEELEPQLDRIMNVIENKRIKEIIGWKKD